VSVAVLGHYLPSAWCCKLSAGFGRVLVGARRRFVFFECSSFAICQTKSEEHGVATIHVQIATGVPFAAPRKQFDHDIGDPLAISKGTA